MENRVLEILSSLTLEEKINLLTGSDTMSTKAVERVGLKCKNFADGPHGVRADYEDNCTSFPNLCMVGATWDKELTEELGEHIAKDCIEHDVDMILGPGINIKRHTLCGRNFEYVSEDPVLAGEICASYINGLQKNGVSASLKHFALNNQEKDRLWLSVDADMRTLMEIYLKPFEIAVKKSSPDSVMCAYNKLHSIWCSENKFLLTEILREMWGYDGFVVSDWGAVHNPCLAFASGLDLQMPKNAEIIDDIKNGIENGEITEEDIDRAAGRIIKFMLNPKAQKRAYDRGKQHAFARKLVAEGTVLLKNEADTLPLTKEKYKKIAVIGEFAQNPLICGQGSAEVRVKEAWIESPLEELTKELGDSVEVKYKEVYGKTSFSKEMLWPKLGEFTEFIDDSDLVLMFIGSMESEDTEQFDRRTANFNPNYEMFIDFAVKAGKKVAVVIQSGSAMILGEWKDSVSAIVQMWLPGEGAGGAVDVLCGKVNPSGRLPETFPTKVRTDLDYPGNGQTVEYNEKLFVGYRYYDKHPEEIVYPFGHGLSYTKFEYKNVKTERKGNTLCVSFDLKNIGDMDGAEVVQIYSGDPVSTVIRPEKELRAFKKVYLTSGETKQVSFEVDLKELGYYNVLLKDWVTEPGKYIIYVGASSRDIRLEDEIFIGDKAPYSIDIKGETMIG